MRKPRELKAYKLKATRRCCSRPVIAMAVTITVGGHSPGRPCIRRSDSLPLSALTRTLDYRPSWTKVGRGGSN